MATRYGHEYGTELVNEHGSAWAPIRDDVCGDRWVVDPVTGVSMSPHEGRRVQVERDELTSKEGTK